MRLFFFAAPSFSHLHYFSKMGVGGNSTSFFLGKIPGFFKVIHLFFGSLNKPPFSTRGTSLLTFNKKQ